MGLAIGIIGAKGSGKTMVMSILGEYLHLQTNAPLRANYSLLNSIPVRTTKDIWQMKREIFCFDEIWITMDSRFWKDNAELSYWIMQIRHREVILLYTAQHRSEIEKRVRLATDLFVLCEAIEKNGRKMHSYTFLEPDIMNEDVFKIGRKYIIDDLFKWYFLYNTRELVFPIEYVKLTMEEIKLL